MSEADVYVLSERALADVIDRVRTDQWSLPRPDWFQHGRAEVVDLRGIVNYHAYDTAWIPDTLAGKTLEEVGDAYDGDLLGDDPAASYRAYADKATAAAQALTDLDRPVHLSYGEFPAREYLKHITSFRTFRAYDIARWIGTDTTLPPDLVEGFWHELLPDVEAWRSMGVYGPAVPVPDDAPLQDRLLGIAGRDPNL